MIWEVKNTPEPAMVIYIQPRRQTLFIIPILISKTSCKNRFFFWSVTAWFDLSFFWWFPCCNSNAILHQPKNWFRSVQSKNATIIQTPPNSVSSSPFLHTYHKIHTYLHPELISALIPSRAQANSFNLQHNRFVTLSSLQPSRPIKLESTTTRSLGRICGPGCGGKNAKGPAVTKSSVRETPGFQRNIKSSELKWRNAKSTAEKKPRATPKAEFWTQRKIPLKSCDKLQIRHIYSEGRTPSA